MPERPARHLGLVPQVDDVYARADILSLHALVVPETLGMINAAAIQKMKPGVLIVNTARGKLINTADLADALRSGRVGGAAIDVYDVEPPPADHPLAGLDNVILMPHLGASTYEAQAAVGIQAAEQVIHYLVNGAAENVRNRAVPASRSVAGRLSRPARYHAVTLARIAALFVRAGLAAQDVV